MRGSALVGLVSAAGLAACASLYGASGVPTPLEDGGADASGTLSPDRSEGGADASDEGGSSSSSGASSSGASSSSGGSGSGSSGASSSGSSSGSIVDASEEAGACACTIGAAACVSATVLETCAPADAGSSSCPSWATASCASVAEPAYVCERAGGAGCVDPSWAEWPMPNAASDAPPDPNPESYTVNGDGTVSDDVTGLMWEQSFSPMNVSWGSPTAANTAQSYCAGLATGGHHDWRLPSAIELLSLVDVSQSPSTIAPAPFPSTPAGLFWSSTPVGTGSSAAWSINFGGGTSDAYGVGFDAYARCVR